MGEMEKEKQAFNNWYNGNTDDSWFFVNNVKSLDKTKPILYGFYGGYHSRDEKIAALKAENERMREALDRIANPIKWIQKDAELDRKNINGGMTIEITKDPQFFIQIAKQALKE